MSESWPLVPLGKAVTPVTRPEVPITGKAYRQVGVRLWGEGAYKRETIDGGQTKYATLSRVEADDIIVNKIWARNGSVAVVPSYLAGCYCSGEFPTFAPVSEKLHPRWMHWLTKTKGFWEQCDEKSRGTSGKNRIKPEQFLQVQVPLPPLSEQRRIVGRVEELAGKIEEARGLRREAVAEAQVVPTAAQSLIFSIIHGYDQVSLEMCCAAIIDNLHSNPEYSEQGTIPCIRSSDVGWGILILNTAGKTTEDEYTRRTVRGEPSEDDIVLVREGGGTGKVALIAQGQRLSLGQRVMMLRPDKNKVLPRFMLYQMLSPAIFQDQIVPHNKGSASPHLNIGSLRKFSFFLPPLPEQERIVAYLDGLQAKVDALKALQGETEKELAALLPSVLDRAFSGRL